MKTKHLLFATALVASLAACTNDDFTIDKQQNVANDGRPTVSDVKLNFVGDGADTRLAFGKDGYAWEANDTIGALLMDEVKDLTDGNTWLEKYTLTEYIHTSYPFTYSTTDKTWSCNTKMLEGNYFFAFPWESYDGNRKVMHSLTDQQQNGVKGSVVAESYAKNQFFVGYSQIKAGTVAKDALTDVEMTSLLGAIQLRIVNTGTQTYHINKVVLKSNESVPGKGLASVLTIDPTDAAYGISNKWNLDGGTTIFNYANYTNNQEDLVTKGGDFVYTIGEGDDYNRMDALRAAVKPASDENFAQLNIKGTEEERALISTKVNEKAVAYALIMANSYEPTSKKLLLDIYTDEGMVQNIDLTEINETSGDYKAITDSKVEKIAPEVANTIKVQIDDNSFVIPQNMEIYNNEDLLQFIVWNGKVAGARVCKATLKKPVTLTKEMVSALKSNVDLTIDGEEALTLAKDVPADVLDNKKLNIVTAVEVLGTVALTKESDEVASITVAEGAILNINVDNANLPDEITNKGTLNVAADVTVGTKTDKIVNKGVMNVGKDADVKATVENHATLNENGYMAILNNEAEGEVVMGEGAIIASGTNANEGVIRTAKNAQVSIENSGEIIYVDGAMIVANGTIAYEATGATIGEKTFEKVNISKLILKKGITSITDDLSFAEVAAEEGASLVVADKKTLTVNRLTVEGSATTKGVIKADAVEVKKGATLTNNGAIEATAFTNNGTVANNGTVVLPEGAKVDGTGTWKYNGVENQKPEAPTKQSTMNDAVKVWAENWKNYISEGTYYSCNPYDIDKFITSLNVWILASEPSESWEIAAAELKKLWDREDKGFAVVLKDEDGKAVPEFTKAIDAVLTDKNFKTLKDVIISKSGAFQTVTIEQSTVLYKNQTGAYDALRTFLANPTNVAGVTAVVAATAWKFTDDEIAAALSKSADKVPYSYIWEGCDLNRLVDIWEEYNGIFTGDAATAVDGNEYSDAQNSNTASGYADMLVEWVISVKGIENNNATVKEAQKALEGFGTSVVKNYRNYSDGQMKAIDGTFGSVVVP